MPSCDSLAMDNTPFFQRLPTFFMGQVQDPFPAHVRAAMNASVRVQVALRMSICVTYECMCQHAYGCISECVYA